MADYSEDLILLDELYRSTKATAGKKTDKDRNADISGEEEDLEGLTTAYGILEDAERNSATGADRDLSEISDGVSIFPQLKSMLARSGRSSNSKYMMPVVTALDAYLEEDGVTVRTMGYNLAKHVRGDGAENAKNAAADNAFSDAVSQVSKKMNDFIKAANDYLNERESNSKPWTTAGKQRRAMVKAAKLQMEDQEKQFADNREKLRDNIKIQLEMADERNQLNLNMSAHVMVRDLLMEERTKQNTEEVETMAKEIAYRISLDESVAGNANGTNDYFSVGSLMNLDRSEEDKKRYDPASLFSLYSKLRSDNPNSFATSAVGVKGLISGKVAAVVDDSPELKKQKAGIAAMFYLITGRDELPSFIYHFIVRPNPLNGEEGVTVEFKHAFPVAVPMLDTQTQGNAAQYVEKIRQEFGEEALESLNYMKYIGGAATAGANLTDPDNEIWTKLSRSLGRVGEEGQITDAMKDKANAIRLRYLSLQGAMGRPAPNP